MTTRMNHERVLIVEDSPPLLELYISYLAPQTTMEVAGVSTGAAALAKLREGWPNVLVLDLQLPDMHGQEVLQCISKEQLPVVVVVITSYATVDITVNAMRYGAFDFLEKPFTSERLAVTVRNALEHYRLTTLVHHYQKDKLTCFHGFIGESDAMQAIYRLIVNVSLSKATVFITGESGTGKELCAEAIHLESQRKENSFVAINCAAIPLNLMESEIFGHVKGAFTGAHATRKGAAATADNGTLFLDEVCDMNLELQTKFLRFVQTGCFQKVGSALQEQVDVRFICATNKDPRREVEAGRFREDLFYRLHVIPITLPPLRERGKDVIIIANHIMAQVNKEERKNFKRLSPEVEEIFCNYAWPGNVRQLQNVLRNSMVLHDGEVITPAMLPPLHDILAIESLQPTSSKRIPTTPGTVRRIKPLWRTEKEAIETAIEICEGNIAKAAALLAVSPSTIYRKLSTWKATPG